MSTEAVTPNPQPTNPDIAKVFIGNLAFATREEDLTNAFDAINVKLHSVNVVVKRGRSMGYGFVEIDEKDLPVALEKLNKTQLGSRTINLEKATSTNSNKQTKKPRKPRNNKRKPRVASGDKPAGEKPAAGDKPAKAAKPAGEKSAAGDKPAASGEKPKKKTQRRKKKPAATGAKPADGQPTVVENGSGAPVAAPAAKKPRTARKPKPVNTNVKRELSNNELYVANIPFTLTDEELKEAFAPYGCVSAIVIINTYGKNKGKSNRGYGFVKVDTEDNQKAAISQDKVLKIGDRDISIKPAFVRSEPAVKPDTQEPEAPKSEEGEKKEN